MARQFDNREKMADLFFAISYYRRRRGMSQEQLAEELGISRQHLAAIEAPNMNRGLWSCFSTSPRSWRSNPIFC